MKTIESEHEIVAIISARAGSKGIPNKNVRLLGGHLLVYYAIKNALDSKFVTKVVVTIDSPCFLRQKLNIIPLSNGLANG